VPKVEWQKEKDGRRERRCYHQTNREVETNGQHGNGGWVHGKLLRSSNGNIALNLLK